MFRFDVTVITYNTTLVKKSKKLKTWKISVTAKSYTQARRMVLEKVWDQACLVQSFDQIYRRKLRGT